MQKITINQIFAKAAEIFKIIFPKLILFYLIAGALPAAAANTYLKGNPFAALALQALSIFVFAVILFYAKAAYEGQTPQMPFALSGFKAGVLPFLSLLLTLCGLTAAAGIAFALVIFILVLCLAPLLKGRPPAQLAVLIILPAIAFYGYLIAKINYAFNIAFVDKVCWFEPIKKSWALTKGYVWKILLIYLLNLPVMLISVAGQRAANAAGYAAAIVLLAPLSLYAATALTTLFFMLRERQGD